MDYHDAEATPAPDRHGYFPYPIDSSSDVLPAADCHGECPYPIDSSDDVQPRADQHENMGFPMHTGKTPFDHAIVDYFP